MFDNLKKRFKRAVRGREVVRLNEQQAAMMKAEEQARGIAEGRAASAEARARKVEKQFRRATEVNVGKYLSDKAKKLRNEAFEGAFSLRRFFKAVEHKNKYNIYSYNFKKRFGKFYDFSILKDGRFAIWIENNGHIEPIITGRNVKDMLRNFGGLSYTATKGHIAINLDENFDFMENIEEKDVPDVILDGNGKIFTSYVDTGPFIQKLAEKSAATDQILQSHRTLEKMIIDMEKENKRRKMYSNLNTERAEISDGELQRSLKQVIEVQRNYGELLRSSGIAANEKQIVEDRNVAIEKGKDRIMEKLGEKFSRDDMEEAEHIIKENISWTIDNLLLKTTKAMEKVKPAPPQLGPIIEEKPKLKLKRK